MEIINRIYSDIRDLTYFNVLLIGLVVLISIFGYKWKKQNNKYYFLYIIFSLIGTYVFIKTQQILFAPILYGFVGLWWVWMISSFKLNGYQTIFRFLCRSIVFFFLDIALTRILCEAKIIKTDITDYHLINRGFGVEIIVLTTAFSLALYEYFCLSSTTKKLLPGSMKGKKTTGNL